MGDFGKTEASDGRNCETCYQGFYHLARGLLCGYTDAATNPRSKCGLYIRRQQKVAAENTNQGQADLF